MGFIIAILLCLADRCDLLRAEPDTPPYVSYDECSAAVQRNSSALSRLASQNSREGANADIVCLRELIKITEVDEEHEALVTAEIRDVPVGNAKPIGQVNPQNKVRVTGTVTANGATWLRIPMPNGKTGYVYGERFRKLSFATPSRTPVAAAPAPQPPQRPGTPTPQPQAQPAPPPQPPPQVAPPPQPPPQVAVRPPDPPRQPPQAVQPPMQAQPTPSRPLQEFRDCPQCPVMVLLPAGSYQMGSNNDPTERPVHNVTITSFAIGKYEVTLGEYRACVSEGACDVKRDGDDRLPMTNLSWDAAKKYVAWLSRKTGKRYRLPSEAEWEYAARAGTSTPYPWGQQVGISKANCNGCGPEYNSAAPVLAGTFAQNAWGLHDMHGGVAEWVEDCWIKDYSNGPNSNAPRETQGRCLSRAIRGGSWKNPPKDIMSTTRNYYDASVPYIANGMRVALTP